jgi:hypothetical protein
MRVSRINPSLILVVCLQACHKDPDAAPLPVAMPTGLHGAGPGEPSDRFYLAGMDDAKEAARFLSALQNATETADRRQLLEMIRFPFTIWNSGKRKRVYSNKAELESELYRVMTPKVIKAVRKATFDSLFVNSQGVMIGDGEVWFSKREDGVRIIAINDWK